MRSHSARRVGGGGVVASRDYRGNLFAKATFHPFTTPLEGRGRGQAEKRMRHDVVRLRESGGGFQYELPAKPSLSLYLSCSPAITLVYSTLRCLRSAREFARALDAHRATRCDFLDAWHSTEGEAPEPRLACRPTALITSRLYNLCLFFFFSLSLSVSPSPLLMGDSVPSATGGAMKEPRPRWGNDIDSNPAWFC